ncbi:hypothetical protein C8R41DRAFT_824653 [Lentinula lateritia]|uniref:Uncharacterized protein n=1 Tax=Lentinula lateritia TaxID=40482 RepID=A0ABQ8VK30_9AGAR|nr:hypothetical protein C8R41DRAFT_824653 [Lentinula lateritia]
MCICRASRSGSGNPRKYSLASLSAIGDSPVRRSIRIGESPGAGWATSRVNVSDSGSALGSTTVGSGRESGDSVWSSKTTLASCSETVVTSAERGTGASGTLTSGLGEGKETTTFSFPRSCATASMCCLSSSPA